MEKEMQRFLTGVNKKSKLKRDGGKVREKR